MSYLNARRFTRTASLAVVAVSTSLIAPVLASADSSSKAHDAKAASTPSSGGASPGATVVKASTSQPAGDSRHMGDRVLRQGMAGHDVRVLQDFLTRAGFPTTIDGQFGPTTRQHVIAFQRAHNLSPTGVVTFSVSQALRAAAARQSTTVLTSAPVAPAGKATISQGLATAPANAPDAVKQVIAAGNRIASTPYVWGGGHASWNAPGYDCSGSVSYALHGAGLLSSPEDSTGLESYGSPGRGQWITIWANSGHTYMYVAGLRFDTSAQSSTGGSRWTREGRSSSGYVVRHPRGL